MGAATRIFCLPFNGDERLVTRATEDHGPEIYEFYGTDDMFPSGRASQFLPTQDLSRTVEFLSGQGIGFNYLLNAFAVDEYLISQEAIFRHLEVLRDAGVQTVTCSVPHFATAIREMGFEVSTSLMQFVRTEQHISHLQGLGYSRVIIDEDATRMVPLIRTLMDSTELPFEILVNSTCLLQCPFRFTHCNVNSISRPEFTDARRLEVKSKLKVCKDYWRSDLSHLLKGSWVRPGDLHRYEDLGISLFKIAGRDKPTESVLEVLDQYSLRQRHGYIFDYLKPFTDPTMEFGIENVRNDALDEFFDFFFDPMRGCDGGCRSCGHCPTWALRICGSSEA